MGDSVCFLLFLAMKILLSIEKATVETVATGNIVLYLIFRFHEEMFICRFHELSHSHASLLIEMGIPILEVVSRLGHEKVETTLNTYGHLYPNKQQQLADKLDKIYAEDSR